ncbi:MAG: tRNA pseudouridine(55) synthase TruB [Ignavibacteriales bacterium]|nr:tRNA pseudouridine(55) synthase TruB [Ignavibacteriales bacterium]MCF8435972.1 tRNA pseudouridine(55) synthase TruB [Ignavibacteriales bacterium]
MITKKSLTNKEYDFLKGECLLVEKPSGMTSFGVIARIRRILKVRKAGHSGTLDPLASGLMIVCTGGSTKKLNSFIDSDKTYVAEICLGKTTSSMDTETPVIAEVDYSHIQKADIVSLLNKFTGEIDQIPPMYSAVKFKGKPLYKYARKGKEVKREARRVNIYSIDIISFNSPFLTIEVRCSKGTYIRVLADDLGKDLGCGAHLSGLRRTSIGEYRIEDAFNFDEIQTEIAPLRAIQQEAAADNVPVIS